jgi:hypothetical protein
VLTTTGPRKVGKTSNLSAVFEVLHRAHTNFLTLLSLLHTQFAAGSGWVNDQCSMGTRTHQQLLRKQFSSCCSALLLLQSLAIAVLFVASCVLLRDEHGASLASSADAPVWYEDFDSGELGRCVDSALELKSSFPDLMGCEEMEPYSAMVEERSKTVEFLGKGHFRNVYALYLDDERAVVYKKMKKKHKESSKRTRSLARERREAAILGALRDNPHLVHIVGLCEFDIITERMPGSLHRLLFSEEREPLSENQVLSMALDAARALQAIHGLDPPVVHADIKVSVRS